jgi:iron complex transport system permease protein
MILESTGKKIFISLGLFFALFLSTLFLAPTIGPVDIDLSNALFGKNVDSRNVDAEILFLARLPRILLAAIAGAGLAVAGAIFQALLRNDLAAPFTLGVSSGASLGAVIAIRFLGVSPQGFSLVPIAAFLGSLLAIALVFGIVPNKRGELPAPVMILAGVTVNFFFAALVMFIHYISDISQSFQIVRWLMGGLDVTDYSTLLCISPLVLIGIACLIFFSRDLNLLSAGIESAQSRGVDIILVQRVGFICASLITGAVVSVCGPITFLGLIVPHIVRLIVGPDNRILIPASMFFGAAFLIMCDTVARTIIAPAEIPVGIITAMLGGPFFVWLLRKKL